MSRKRTSRISFVQRMVQRTGRLLSSLLRHRGGRYAVACTLFLAAIVGGLIFAWQQIGDQVLSGDDYRLAVEGIEIIPSPAAIPWIHRDIRTEVIRNGSLDSGPSILEADLNDRIAQAFRLHPWIEKVDRVTKHYPARVTVEVVYRRPVAIVAVGKEAWYPVDRDGYVLPIEDFSPIEAGRYPRVAGIANGPAGPVGSRWGDARILGGAAVAEAFGADWEKLKLRWIIPSQQANAEGDFGYQLETASGRRRIHWGRAPGSLRGNEMSAKEKVALLLQYAGEHGSLDLPVDSHDLDLRSRGRLLKPRHSAAGFGAPVIR